jgi:hypothetical protein
MIPIRFEVVSAFDKKEEPATTGIPLEKGVFRDGDLERAAIIADDGAQWPAQFAVTSRWDDGSVRWLLAHILADLPANTEKTCYLAWDGSPGPKKADLLRLNGGAPELDNGVVRARFAAAGAFRIFDSLEVRGISQEPTLIRGPFIKEPGGKEFCICIPPDEWEVLGNGPVRAAVRTKGKHYDGEGKTWLDYTLAVYAWRGKPWLEFDYQFINRETAAGGGYSLELTNEQAGFKYDANYPHEFIGGIEVRIRPESKKRAPVQQKILTSSFNYYIQKAGADQKLSHLVNADTIIETANEMFPEVLFSIYALDWNDGESALTAGIYQAYQNFPKALYSSSDEIHLKLFPEGYSPLKVGQGLARTSRFHLHFRDTVMPEREIVDREYMFELPALPTVDVRQFIKSSVFGNAVDDHFHHPTERFLYRYVDSRSKGLGMLNFGDCPEWEYVKQGRSSGRDVWINNEYDMPHNFMIMLARTADRRYFDYLKAAAEHWYDVDVCHFSEYPYKQGLLYTHSVEHITGQPVPSHQWVEGFLDYYHLTGNIVGYETALGIGESLLELVKLPIYSDAGNIEPREAGWAMRTFLALYRETWEDRWLDACVPIVDVYIDWADRMGSWPSRYPDNYLDRVPFMIQVGLEGLHQYNQIRPEKRIWKTILAVIDDMIRTCYVDRAGTFFGKQSPPVRYLNLNGMALGSMAIAYELTGDSRYIRKGYGLFQWITQENQPPVYDFSKVKRDNFTVIYDCPAGPKRCAQSLLPVLRYYRYAMELVPKKD